MAGLNYGRSFTLNAGDYKNRKEGVFYMPKIKKYIVRIKKGGGVTTISQHKNEAEAYKAYECAVANCL